MFTIKINSKDAENNIVAQAHKYTKSLSSEVVNRMKGAGEIVRTNTIEVLSGQGHGKWYGRHQASRPGEPPAQDTGNLRNSFRAFTQKRIEGRKLTVTSGAVSNTSKNAYGVRSEGRTPNENYAWIDVGMGRIKPRPYSKKVAEKSFKQINELLTKRYHV